MTQTLFTFLYEIPVVIGEKEGKTQNLFIVNIRSAQLSVESTQIITITEISWHAVDWYFGSKGDLKGFHAVISDITAYEYYGCWPM